MSTYSYTATLVQKTCPVCGIDYAVPDVFINKREEKGGNWHCPNGHSLVFVETTEQKLAKAEADLVAKEHRLQATRDLLAAEERSHAATRGVVTKQKKKLVRVTNGVCPCCNRTFQNLMRHMDTKHPEYAAPEVPAE